MAANSKLIFLDTRERIFSSLHVVMSMSGYTVGVFFLKSWGTSVSCSFFTFLCAHPNGAFYRAARQEAGKPQIPDQFLMVSLSISLTLDHTTCSLCFLCERTRTHKHNKGKIVVARALMRGQRQKILIIHSRPECPSRAADLRPERC